MCVYTSMFGQCLRACERETERQRDWSMSIHFNCVCMCVCVVSVHICLHACCTVGIGSWPHMC